MTKVTIVTSNGETISTNKINGDNYVFDEEIDTSIFENATATITVADESETNIYENMIFTQQQKQRNGEYYICFHPLSKAEIILSEAEKLTKSISENDEYSDSMKNDLTTLCNILNMLK